MWHNLTPSYKIMSILLDQAPKHYTVALYPVANTRDRMTGMTFNSNGFGSLQLLYV